MAMERPRSVSTPSDYCLEPGFIIVMVRMQSDSSLTRIIHDGSSPLDLLMVPSPVEGRNRQDALRDGHTEA